MSKHAYMIIAHNQFELLERLVLALDDERNDIFIHIDAKVEGFDFEHFCSITKHSSVRFTDKRVNITWGDSSQVECEQVLLKTAVDCESADEPYAYYHLLSGVDLPIKSNDEIHRFFDLNNGKEFVHMSSNTATQGSVNRIRYYHFFRDKRNTFYKILSQLLLRIQKLLGVNRLKHNGLEVQKGCNWFSITGDFARYVVSRQEEYSSVFRYSYCCDEVFIQTMLVNSEYKDRLYMPDCNNKHDACVRLIDWERGNPYVWRIEDYDYIINSPCMFARKFDINIDSKIIDKILIGIK